MTMEDISKSFNALSLDRMKIIGTILMVISLPFSEFLKTISMLFVLLIFLIQLHKKEIKIEMSVIHYGFIFLLLSALISSVFAQDPARSMRGAKDVLFYTIPFFVACTINDEKDTRIILWSLYVSTVAAALLGIFHSIQTHKLLEIHSLGNQNYTAMFLIIVASSMISTIIFSEKETQLSKVVVSIFVSLMLIAAIMTAMRTSFLAFFLFVAILFLRYWQRKSVKLVAFMLFVLITVITYFYKPMWSKLFMTKSLVSRIDIWKHAVEYFRENPVVGIGLNHYSHSFPLTHPVEPGNTVYDAHNVYFQTASQMGSLGLISLLLIIFGFFYKWVKLTTISSHGKVIKYSALGSFLVTFVGGIFDTTLHHEHAIAFTLITGLMFGYDNGRKIHNAN